MASTTLPPGTTLFLRPEDTTQDVEEGFYATVVSATDTTVVAERLDQDDAGEKVTISAVLAVTRVVPDEEPTGSRTSALLRKGVACIHHGDVLFGQVIATSDIAVHVATVYGQRWVPRVDIISSMSPLLTMLMYGLSVNEIRWTETFIREVDARLSKCLEEALSCPAMEEVMDAIDKLSAVTPKGADREWREMKTGRIRPTTTDHALLFTYYVDGGRIIPPFMKPMIGDSVAADPARLAIVANAATRQSTKRPRSQSGFLASETSFDNAEVEEKGTEPAGYSYMTALADASGAGADGGSAARSLRMRASNVPVRPTTNRMRAVPSTSPLASPRRGDREATTSAQAMATLRERLADDPDLIRLLRVATSTDEETGKGRNLFKPTSGVRLVHEMMTAEEHQGMSPHAFILRLVASPAVQFYPYPAVLTLLYQFSFGPGGVSIMHFVKTTLLDRLALQESNSVNMQDYAASATLPTARKPRSWSDIQDAVNGLVTFCNMYSDPTTRRLVATLAGFVSAMQAYDNWPESRLNILVYWINERLFAYRGIFDQYVHERSGDPTVALAWFAPSNPDLAPLRSTVFQLEMAALQESARSTSVHSSLPQPSRSSRTHAQPTSSSASRSGIPPNVLGAIPKRGGHELCLKFASVGGCKTSGQTCSFNGRVRGHFVDRSMPRPVRQYIVSRLGGLSSDYADTE